MACHISFRDVDFHATTVGVRLRVWTDLPCRVRVRVSLRRPWVHMTPSLRRGVAFAEDVRFCFTVYSDVSQHESGETVIHTFYFTDWPACQTRWFYFFGNISGDTCLSTSPYFEFHNEGIDPETPPGPPAAGLVIGHVASSSPSIGHSLGYTYVSKYHPSTVEGVISEVQFYRHNANYDNPILVGLCYVRLDGKMVCTTAWNLTDIIRGEYLVKRTIAGAFTPGLHIGIYSGYDIIRYVNLPPGTGGWWRTDYWCLGDPGNPRIITAEHDEQTFKLNFQGFPREW